jgi:hypothetical protein
MLRKYMLPIVFEALMLALLGGIAGFFGGGGDDVLLGTAFGAATGAAIGIVAGVAIVVKCSPEAKHESDGPLSGSVEE